jgi:hypothetical protein
MTGATLPPPPDAFMSCGDMNVDNMQLHDMRKWEGGWRGGTKVVFSSSLGAMWPLWPAKRSSTAALQ